MSRRAVGPMVVLFGLLAVDGLSGPSAARAVSAAAPVRATCATGGKATTEVVRTRDAVLGPLVVLGAQRTAWRQPDAFNRHGYKLPATLPEGMTVTLSVPRRLHGHVGLVFSHRTQDRVWKGGVKAADRSVRFSSCEAGDRPGRTGWPGGLVVDRRRCATLVVTITGRKPIHRRVSLGRRCR